MLNLGWLLSTCRTSRFACIKGLKLVEALGQAFLCWVAVEEVKSSNYEEETLLFTVHIHYGNLIS